MSYVDEVIGRVVKENPNEPEFHQAVKEVLDSLRPVVEVNEQAFRRDALLERLVNPERQIKFRSLSIGTTDRMPNTTKVRAYGVSSVILHFRVLPKTSSRLRMRRHWLQTA